jgi:hypothetical protein
MNNVCQSSLVFKNVSNITEDLLLNSIEANLKLFLDWAFLSIGGWFDVSINENTLQNDSYDKLILADDKAYTPGTVWESQRKDWVWETITYCDRSPISNLGLTINGNAVASNNYTINYPLGRIILNSAVPASSNIRCNYSYRYAQTYRANDSDWFSLIQYNGPTTTKAIDRLSNGSWQIGKTHTIQLPAIVIESLPRSRSRPHEIGSGGLVLEQDFAFHILADNKNDRNKIVDILRLQQDLTIWLFDTNLLTANNKYPLEYNGSLKQNALMYPDIIGQYPWKKCWLKNINVFEVDSVDPNMHRAAVRMTAEIIYT